MNIRIKDTPSLIGAFPEPPILVWDETILVINHDVGSAGSSLATCTSMNPAAPPWPCGGSAIPGRTCTPKARLTSPTTPKGYSKLFDKNGAPVQGAALGAHADKNAPNKAIQDYLKRNGGILKIEVYDIPGIAVQPGKTKDIERVLIFNCGVKGMGPRVKTWQHLKVNSGQPRTAWYRRCQMDANPRACVSRGSRSSATMPRFPIPHPLRVRSTRPSRRGTG